MLGTTPTTVGTTPIMLGTTPTTVGTTLIMLGTTPTMVGTTPIMLGTTPTMVGNVSPSTTRSEPKLSGRCARHLHYPNALCLPEWWPKGSNHRSRPQPQGGGGLRQG